MAHALSETLARVRLLVLDVDGVLTDGRVVMSADGEMQFFDVRDGQGLRWLVGAGVRLAWITGRGSGATARRARELGVEDLVTGVKAKGEALQALQKRRSIEAAHTVAMGDDLPDLAFASHAAALICPADASAEVRKRADLVTVAAGGRGAVRELAERILVAKGLWDEVVSRYAADPR